MASPAQCEKLLDRFIHLKVPEDSARVRRATRTRGRPRPFVNVPVHGDVFAHVHVHGKA